MFETCASDSVCLYVWLFGIKVLNCFNWKLAFLFHNITLSGGEDQRNISLSHSLSLCVNVQFQVAVIKVISPIILCIFQAVKRGATGSDGGTETSAE